MALIDVQSGYFLPTFCPTSSGLVCACDMCFDSDIGPRVGIGPHDLHCVCDNCLHFARDDDKYHESVDIRYPVDDVMSDVSDDEMEIKEDLEAIYDSLPQTVRENLEQIYESLDQKVKDRLSDVLAVLVKSEDIAPPNSPTNQEMHAYNGNQFHQHHHGWGDFIRAAGRGLARSTNPADKFALAGLGSAGLIGSALGYTSTQNMSKPLSELRTQIFGGVEKHDPNRWQKVLPKVITNQEMHAQNGNIKHDFGDQWKNAEKLIHSEDDIKHHNKSSTKFGDEWLKNAEKIISAKNPKKAPSNKEMHAINGNIYGPKNKGVKPKTHKNQLKRLARKINKARGRPRGKMPKIVINNKPAVAKSRGKSKWIKKETSQFKKEEAIAKRYTKFLQNPVYMPPLLGSTGETPVKLLHGFFETTINMASALGVANCTDFIAYLSPKMFGIYTSDNNYVSPVTIGVAINSTSPFLNTAGTSAMATFDFTNITALKAESGAATSTTAIPLARYLGGHISVRCRCPMATTAPPFIFGGLLPSQAVSAANSLTVDTSKQLNALTNTTIRGMNSSVEIDGFEAGSVYFPSSSKALDFSQFVCQYNNAYMDPTAVPYVGMTGCPTTASLTIICSAWFEVQQNATNQYYSGWRLGPKVSTEDVYDRLSHFKTANGISFNQGGKTNSGSSRTMFSVADYLQPVKKDPEQELTALRLQLQDLNTKFDKLSINTDPGEEDDEKYFTHSPESTSYKSLSRSTIDLALQLKDKLTPGSVTSKASRIALP